MGQNGRPKLILVSTPIGNDADFTPRAKESILAASHIYAEDTRVFRSLLSRLGLQLNAKIDSFHDHSGEQKLSRILEVLNSGQDICLVSDAGSPIVSDPAYPLVQAILAEGFELETCPGVSSVLVALELSALPPIPFHFHGFLPREDGKKDRILEEWMGIQGTHLFFESPHRIEKTMNLLCQSYPERSFYMGRELTKQFQSSYRFKGSEWDSIKSDLTVKGEFVCGFYAPSSAASGSGASSKVQKLAQECLAKPSPKKLSKLLAELTGGNAKEIYKKFQS